MKKLVLIAMMIFTVITYAQKKKNGTVYKDHPAISAVEAYNKAYFSGDSAIVASMLTDDFKSFNGNSTNKNSKGRDKKWEVGGVNWFKKNFDHVSIERSSGAYPDAIEYKDEDNKDVVWVQTWDHFKGLHKKTGIKFDMPIHNLYVVDKENKIKTIIGYTNDNIWRELNQSYDDRENGTIYNHHDYINIVRRMVHSLEFNDMDTYYSFFDEKAKFRNIHMPVGESMTMEEDKEGMKKMREEFDITSIDVSGYPDYLNYGLGNAKVVQSWWNLRMTRKSDKKKIVVPVMLIHNFNDDGKITYENAYYSQSLMMAK